MTDQEIQVIIDKAKEMMEHSLEHLHKELVKLRTGKASTAILNGLLVDYYGSPTLRSQIANVSTPDYRTLSNQPW